MDGGIEFFRVFEAIAAAITAMMLSILAAIIFYYRKEILREEIRKARIAVGLDADPDLKAKSSETKEKELQTA